MKQEIQIRLKEKLWEGFVECIPEYPKIFCALVPTVDHYAIIDLPSSHSGIHYLKTAFEKIGLEERGQGYIPQKQNDFIWMADSNFERSTPKQATPQVVLADFRKNELSKSARKIVEKYASYKDDSFDLELFEAAVKLAQVEATASMLMKHLNIRPWPQPTLSEYLAVNEENPLLAWVLLFGRKVNHFGVSIYNMNHYSTLDEFNIFIQDKHAVKLNAAGGIIKGSPDCGIEQSSTIGALRLMHFDGKIIEVNDCFLEFIWRHPITNRPRTMGDYYMGFLPSNANKVIESLYAIK